MLEHDLITKVPTLDDLIHTLLAGGLGAMIVKKLLLYWLYKGAPTLNSFFGKQIFKQGEERRMGRQDFERLLKESEVRTIEAVKEIFK